MAKCRYLSCIRPARKGHNTCYPCDKRLEYWEDKTPAERLERRRKLDLSGQTMAELVREPQLRMYVKKEHKKELKELKANG